MSMTESRQCLNCVTASADSYILMAAMPDYCDSLYRFPYLDDSIHMMLCANAQVQLPESKCSIMNYSA